MLAFLHHACFAIDGKCFDNNTARNVQKASASARERISFAREARKGGIKTADSPPTLGKCQHFDFRLRVNSRTSFCPLRTFCENLTASMLLRNSVKTLELAGYQNALKNSFSPTSAMRQLSVHTGVIQHSLKNFSLKRF